MEKYVVSKKDFLRNILKISDQELPKIEHSWYIPIKLKQLNGKERVVYTLPGGNILARFQERLNRNLFNTFYLSDAAHGFVQGRSYRTFLESHVNDPYHQKNKLFLKLDIKNFFPSINENIIKRTLDEYFKIENPIEKEAVLNWTVSAITLDGKLPMGAKTSPVISNLVFRRIDARIQKYCFDTNIEYTRYADDLLFSSYRDVIHSERLINLIVGILKEYEMELNYNKIRRGIGFFSINGFVIDDKIRLSRKKLKEIRSVLFVLDMLSKEDLRQKNLLEKINGKIVSNSYVRKFYSLSHLNNYLAGHRSFLIAWLPNQQTSFQLMTKKLIQRIDKHIEQVSDYIERKK
ncbi:reverse transcriptase family protein [Sporosarcina koreensis]|uniref:RNA-directed DNA polymerase n=1 Tax=Sporosarcina koreensis TaxID=334735 RepID=A0ABW0TU60_9BACL